MRCLSLAAAITLAAPVGAQTPATPAAPPAVPSADTAIVRALYVNRFAAQSPKKMKELIAIADSTEINALVIDVKDEFGLNIMSNDSLVKRNAGRAGVITNAKALLDTLRAHNILSIARIVVFKDSVTARVNPAWNIRTEDGSVWRDKKGLAWVNPYNHDLWEYNLRVAEEAARLGFREVQFDYIRFPEPYKTLPPQVFPGGGTTLAQKQQALGAFLALARSRLAKFGVRTTADIFGLVTSVPGALEVGQQWETLAPSVDVLLPMVYPSHYPHGAFDIPRPNAEPYKVVRAAIAKAYERDAKLKISGEHVRPYLQAFSLGPPSYGANELREQKRAVYDAGYDGWVLWNPGSSYGAFAGALEKTLVSHKSTPPRTGRENSQR